MPRPRHAQTATRRHAFTQRPTHMLAASALAAALTTVPLLASAPASAAPVITVPATPVDSIQSVTQYTLTNVNVRSGPGTSHSVVGSYAKSTKLTGTWSNGWLKVGTNRYVGGSVLTSTPPSTDGVVRYTRTSVNVRSGPSTSDSVVDNYAKGTKVTGTLTGNGWLNLGSGRYIAGSVLVSSPPDSQTVVRYTRTTSNVRSGPSTSHNVVDQHSAGTKLTGTLTSNGWLSTGSSRFVSGAVLTTDDPGEDTGPVSGQDVLTEGRKYFGIMYAYGGNSPSEGFDCSGYTQYTHGQLGITLPRSAAAQQDFATPISNPQPGDLVFWGDPAYHVGIYAGDGYIYDSGKPGLPVQKRSMFSGVSGYGRVL